MSQITTIQTAIISHPILWEAVSSMLWSEAVIYSEALAFVLFSICLTERRWAVGPATTHWQWSDLGLVVILWWECTGSLLLYLQLIASFLTPQPHCMAGFYLEYIFDLTTSTPLSFLYIDGPFSSTNKQWFYFMKNNYFRSCFC